MSYQSKIMALKRRRRQVTGLLDLEQDNLRRDYLDEQIAKLTGEISELRQARGLKPRGSER